MTVRTVLVGLIVGGVLLTSCGGDATTTTSIGPTPGLSSTTTTSAPDSPTTTRATSTTSISTTTTTPGVGVLVYYSTGDGTDCGLVGPFERTIPTDVDPIFGALEQLVGGPTTTEEAAGAGSFFSGATADAVLSATLTNGLLTVDLFDHRDKLSNTSTSCGSEAFLSSLNETVFQFSQVERVRYTIFGSCNAFYNWLQMDCQDQTRTGPVNVDLNTNELASGSGCTPGTAVLPDGEWFGYVDTAAGSNLEFDLACWFSGVPAADAAAEDGSESPPPNDYYVRNQSAARRTVAVSDTAEVQQLVDAGGPDLTTVTYAEWSAGWGSLDYQPGVWLTIKDGKVATIVEQYVP